MNHEQRSVAGHPGASPDTPSFARAALGFAGSIALLCLAAFALSVV